MTWWFMVLQVFYFSLNVEFMFLFSHFFIAFEWYIRGKGKTFYGQCRNKCPLNFWDTIRSTKIWEREFLVFHLYRLGEVELKMFIKQFISWERKKAKSLLCYNRFCTSFSEKLRIIILEYFGFRITSVSSVAQLCPTLCDPMNHSTPGLPVHHHLLDFTQTHVHRVGDAIQPSHPLSSPFPPAPNPSQHQDYLV